MNVLTTAPMYYNTNGAEPTTKFGKFFEGATKFATGVQTALPYAAQIAQRPRTDVKQACGRKPLFGEKKRQWEKCAQNFYARQSAPQETRQERTPKKAETNYLWYALGGVALIGVIIFAVKK